MKYIKWKGRLKVNLLSRGKRWVFCPSSSFSFWRRALGRDRCSTYLAESVPAPRAVPESLYIASELCWGQVIRQLVKHTTNDSSWQQTFHRAWKRARMTRLTQHLENTPIKKNVYRKTKQGLTSQNTFWLLREMNKLSSMQLEGIREYCRAIKNHYRQMLSIFSFLSNGA